MPNLINVKTGQPEDLDYNDLPTAFQSGSHSLPKGSSLPLKDETGNLVSVPAEQVPGAISNGLSFPSTDEINTHNEKINYNNPVGAVSAGALRGLSFGTSDYALQKLGISQEDLSKLKQYNPIASTAGEIGSIGAALLTPAGAFTAPGLISEIGNSAATAARSVATLSPEASLASRIIARVAPKALGSAIEGGLYGAGNVVSEKALGDPHLTAQSALSQIGSSALFGSALGSILPSPYTSEAKGLVSDLKSAGDEIVGGEPSISLPDIISDSNLSNSAKKSYIEKMSSLKDNADEIKNAANELGVPAFEEQLAADKGVQGFGRDLRASPTAVGMARAKAVDGALDSVENQISQIVKPSEIALTDHELGQKLQSSLTDKFTNEYDPLKQVYNELEQNGKAVSLEPKDASDAAKNLFDSESVKLSPNSDQAQFLTNSAKDIANLQTLDQIKAYGSLIAKETIGKPNLRYAASLVRKELDNLENSTISNLSEQLKGDPNFPPDLIDELEKLPQQRALADEKYSELMNKMEEIAGAAGKSKTYGPQYILNFLNDLSPTKLASKLFTKNDPEFLGFMKQNFPEELQSIVDSQKGKILEKATFDGRINPSKVLNQVDKFSPEVQKVIFSEQELNKLNAASTYLESFGKSSYRVTPASSILSGVNLLRHPLKGVIQNAADYAGLKAVQRALGSGETRTVGALMAVENLAVKSAKAIASGTKALVSSTAPFSSAVAARLVAINNEDQYNKIEKELANVQESPDGLLGHLERSTEDLHQHMPQVSQAMQQSIVRANQYMQLVMPQKQVGPLDKPYKPNTQEMAKVIDSYSGITNPISILKDLKVGVLNHNKILAAQTVHPELVQEMKSSLVQSITNKGEKLQAIPYQNKMILSKFLGMPLTSKGLNVGQLQSTYMTPQPPISPNSIGKRGTKGSLTRLNIAEGYLTPAQKLGNSLK